MDPLSSLNHYQRYFVEEFAEDFKEARMSRREMLRKVLYVTGSIPLAAAVLTSLGCGSNGSAPESKSAPTTAPAQIVATQPQPTPPPASGPGVTVQPTDPAIQVEQVRFKGGAGDVIAYLARPRVTGTFPAVVVIHENRGLVEHIKDVARRYAKENFVALAVDLLSRQGGTTDDQAAASGNLSRASTDDLTADLKSGVDFLKVQNFVRPGALGVTGFCFGGSYTWELALASPDLKAAVPYYGSLRQPLFDQLGQTRAAVLAIYGGNDTRITSQSPQVEERLKAAGKTVEIKIYAGANHAFFNDTLGSYNADAAKDAWPLTLGWFRKYLTA